MPVVLVDPWGEVLLSLLGVLEYAGVGPFAQGGLDETFGFAVGSRGVGPGAAVFDPELFACVKRA